MSLNIRFADASSKPKSDAKGEILVLPLAAGKALPAHLKSLDGKSGGLIASAFALESFAGKKGQTFSLLAPVGAPHARILLVGLGEAADVKIGDWQKAGGAALAALNGLRAKSARVRIEVSGGKGKAIAASEAAAQFAFGAALRDYRFDKYRTKQKPEDKATLATLAIESADSAKAKTRFAGIEGTVRAVHFARDLVSEPANILYPASYAELIKQLQPLGVQVEILLPAQLKKLGMGALLGVGQGSAQDSRVVVMRWNGAANKKTAPIAFVGKGVTFDTGGISIKPAGGMEDMKWDMAGSAAVVGTMYALAARKAKVNAVGVVGLVENMPSGTAQRPGDIVRSMSGQTIEVLNTDAEGRLVLADALWYTQDRFKPQLMIDLATLTGAVIIALGGHKAGLFSNDETLAKRLFDSGEEIGEALWRLPLGDEYDRQMDSPVADMQNISNTRDAGSTMGAVFLQRFVNGTPWAHLDIAGTAWSKKDTPTCPKGATAFGVRLLDDFVAKHYEKK